MLSLFQNKEAFERPMLSPQKKRAARKKRFFRKGDRKSRSGWLILPVPTGPSTAMRWIFSEPFKLDPRVEPLCILR
jgi:hypothetical protein